MPWLGDEEEKEEEEESPRFTPHRVEGPGKPHYKIWDAHRNMYLPSWHGSEKAAIKWIDNITQLHYPPKQH